MLLRLSLLLLLFSGEVGAIEIAEINRAEPVDFATEVYPFLKENCIACHNASKAKADLNMETPQAMRKGSADGDVLVPGDSMESLILLVSAHLEEEFMPPEKNKAKARNLTPEELGLLKRWIDEGAKGDAPVMSPAELDWQAVPETVTPVYAIAISEDNRFVAFNRGNRVLIYNVALRHRTAELVDESLGSSAHMDIVQALAFAPDGTLASGGFQSIKLWRQPANVRLADLEAMDAAPVATAVSGDLMAAGAADGTIVLWNVASGETKRWKDEAVRVLALTFAEGKVLSVHESGAVRVQDDAAARNLPSPAVAAAWFPDGMLATVSAEGIIRVVKLVDGSVEVVKEWQGDAGVTRMDAVPGQILTGVDSGDVKIWSIDQGAVVRSIQHGSQLSGMAFSEDGAVVATSGVNLEAKLWSTTDGKLLHTLRGSEDASRDLAALTRDRDLANQVLENSKRKREEALKAVADSVNMSKEVAKIAAVAKVGLEAKKKAADEAQIVRENEEQERDRRAAIAHPRLNESEASVKSAVAEFDRIAAELETARKEMKGARQNVDLAKRHGAQAGETLAVAEVNLAAHGAGRDALETQVVQAGEALKKMSVGMTDVGFSQDGRRVAVACDDGRIRCWSVETGEALDQFTHSLVSKLTFTENGDIFAMGEKSTIVWDVNPAWRLQRVIGGLEPDKAGALTGRVSALDFSPDGQWLASASGEPSRQGDLIVWNPADGTILQELREIHSDTVNAIAFSADGDFLGTASADRFARIVDTETWTVVKSLEGHSSHVNAIAWRADGEQVATGSLDMSVKIWNPADGKQIQTNQGYGKAVTAAAFTGISPHLVSASTDKSLRIDNDRFPDVRAILHCAAVSADGELVVAGDEDGCVTGWKVTDRTKVFRDEVK